MSFFEIVAQLSDSMLRSTWIFLLTLVFSMPLGLLICVARMYAWKPVQWLMKFYISVVRGTPLMLQLLVIYFGKYFLFGLPLTTNYRFWAVIIAFSLNYAAYFAEIFRSGIQAIDKGQMEAGRSLGLSSGQTMKLIIMPQAFKNVLPALINEMIVLLKETSIIGYIGMTDITKAATLVQSRTYEAFVPLIAAAVFYWVLVTILTYFMGKLERRLRKSDRK